MHPALDLALDERGLIALPTSWAATTFSIRPSSSRITTCVAQPYAKCVTGSSTSGPRGVVQSTTNSPRNSWPASSSSGRPSSSALSFPRASSTALPPSTVAREAVVCPVSSSRSVSTATRMRSGGRPSSSQAIWLQDGVHALAHLRPGVEERHRPSASGRRTARPYSVRPLPMPVFLTPQAMPA